MSQVRPNDGLDGFAERVLTYFSDFIATDFKRQSAPRRSIRITSEAGFRLALATRKYQTLNKALWDFVASAPKDGLTFRIPQGKYKAPISQTLRDLIEQRVANIDDTLFDSCCLANAKFCNDQLPGAHEKPEAFLADVLQDFAVQVDTKIIHPLLQSLEAHFQTSAYSAVESIYDLEVDLQELLCSGVGQNIGPALNTLIVSHDPVALGHVYQEFFAPADGRAKLIEFFSEFSTADAWVELRDLHQSLRSAENQSLYLYLCEIRYGSHAFPLFYVPAGLEYQAADSSYVLTFDPHLMVAKQTIDWILQEERGPSARVPVSPVTERILYLDETDTFLDKIAAVLQLLTPSFPFISALNPRSSQPQQANSPTVKVSNSSYLAVFDVGEEAMLNDFEELLTALRTEQEGASTLFGKIIRGFIQDNPVSVDAAIEAGWQQSELADRLVCESPIPVNEEQRKIQAALRDPNCNYVQVQGPPGTGKTHLIVAIACDYILAGKSVLVLSDKGEALDVVEDKLESALAQVRGDDSDFPNPILRLGKEGNSFPRITAASAAQKIKQHHIAAQPYVQQMQSEAVQTGQQLRADIAQVAQTLSQIRMPDLQRLHTLEAQIGQIRPDYPQRLQEPAKPDLIPALALAAEKVSLPLPSAIADQLVAGPDGQTLYLVAHQLKAWEIVSSLSSRQPPKDTLKLFTSLEGAQIEALRRYIAGLESLRMPILGFFFSRAKAQALSVSVAKELGLVNPIDLHLRLADLKAIAAYVSDLAERLGAAKIQPLGRYAYHLAREGLAATQGIETLSQLANGFMAGVAKSHPEANLRCGPGALANLDQMLGFVKDAAIFAQIWQSISSRMKSLPTTDYVGVKSRLEGLQKARMTHEIDKRFVDFVDQKRATVREFAGIIKGRKKFPADEFQALATAFPVIIAGLREYADYVPLRAKMFDLIILDEASQISVAQALPALLRAQKVLVLGDMRQFGNVKSLNASNLINTAHLSDLDTYFRQNVSDAATKIERLKHFDVKRSILEFTDLICNYRTMLRKHFRGLPELIDYSSHTFYNGELQAIKIRANPIEEVIRFQVLNPSGAEGKKNTNLAEAQFILQELREMIDEGEEISVGVITPFREQAKLLNELLLRDEYGPKFERTFNLRVWTFDTCQGEERDLIVMSFVATAQKDSLNYIFPPTTESLGEHAEDSLKAQRLNVGFSRAKEAMLFVVSKPIEGFQGAIGAALRHYQAILNDRSKQGADATDPRSPMESKVLDWIRQSAFYRKNQSEIEITPQFPIGQYLKQLDPSYKHPAYRCDFLVRYASDDTDVAVIVEYDGFTEHFTNRANVHEGNWDRYYRPEDVERQLVIESYGYRFLRLNRFNLTNDPISYISKRLSELIKVGERAGEAPQIVEQIREDAQGLADKSKKVCSTCQQVKDLDDYWDKTLGSGAGGYGRICLDCKSQRQVVARNRPRGRRWRAAYHR